MECSAGKTELTTQVTVQSIVFGLRAGGLMEVECEYYAPYNYPDIY